MHKRIKKLVENPSFEYKLALAPCLLKSAQPPEGIEGNSHTEFAHHDAVQMIICTSHHTTWMVKAVKCHLFDFWKEQLPESTLATCDGRGAAACLIQVTQLALVSAEVKPG